MGVSPMGEVLRTIDRSSKTGAFFFALAESAPIMLIRREYQAKSRSTAIMGETPMLRFVSGA